MALQQRDPAVIDHNGDGPKFDDRRISTSILSRIVKGSVDVHERIYLQVIDLYPLDDDFVLDVEDEPCGGNRYCLHLSDGNFFLPFYFPSAWFEMIGNGGGDVRRYNILVLFGGVDLYETGVTDEAPLGLIGMFGSGVSVNTSHDRVIGKPRPIDRNNMHLSHAIIPRMKDVSGPPHFLTPAYWRDTAPHEILLQVLQVQYTPRGIWAILSDGVHHHLALLNDNCCRDVESWELRQSAILHIFRWHSFEHSEHGITFRIVMCDMMHKTFCIIGVPHIFPSLSAH